MTARHQLSTFSPLKVIYSLGFIAVALMIVNVVMSARVAQDGLAVDQLLKQESNLKVQITLLEQQLLNSTSLQDLSLKAQSMGYQQPNQVVSINASNRIAQF